MPGKKYLKRSQELLKAIDIAVKVFQDFPPEDFEEEHIRITVESYEGMKETILHAEPQFQNMQSLRYDEEAVFTYFNEAAGTTVSEFWKQIKAAELNFQRDNKLEKIFKRQKIKDDHEFQYVIDVMVPFQEDGLITVEQADLLNKWLGDYDQAT